MELDIRIRRLTVRAAGSGPDAALLRDIEGTLCEGYAEALARDARGGAADELRARLAVLRAHFVRLGGTRPQPARAAG